MKTIISTLLTAVMLLSVMAGCARDKAPTAHPTPVATAAATATARPTAPTGSMKSWRKNSGPRRAP